MENEWKKKRVVEKMVLALDQRVAQFQQKIIISNARISSIIDKIERDVELMGSIMMAQPSITDALFQAFFRFEEDRKKIEKLKKELSVGGQVPMILLDSFNLTQVANQATLKHYDSEFWNEQRRPPNKGVSHEIE